MSLEELEEGYMYVAVSRDSRPVAEIYCVKEPGKPDSMRYGVFMFKGDEELENYCGTPDEVAGLVAPCLECC